MSGTHGHVMGFFFKIARQTMPVFRNLFSECSSIQSGGKLHLELFSKCSLEQKLTYFSMHVYLSALHTWVTYSAYLYDIGRHNNPFIQQLLS